MDNVRLIPRVCVASHNSVASVLLVSKSNNLKKIRSVSLDESSRTSATLVKIVFKEFLKLEPDWTTSSPDLAHMLRESDAALIIGDPAMTFDRRNVNVWDMATLWKDFTGRGFVFAMWMTNLQNNQCSVDFAGAKDEGVNAIEEIIKTYKRTLGLSDKQIRDYLTNNVTFELDGNLQQGMQLYFQLAEQHGLLEKRRPLEVLD